MAARIRKRRPLLIYGPVVLVALLGVRFYLLATAPDLTPPAGMADDLPPNPLPDCPDSPNCARTTRVYDLDADALLSEVRTALQATGADLITPDGDRKLRAVYRAFVFKDDVHVAVEQYGTGAAFHIRSASRVGYSDLGVNARRVKKIVEALEDRLG